MNLTLVACDILRWGNERERGCRVQQAVPKYQ